MNWPECFHPTGVTPEPSNRPVRLMDLFYLTHAGHTDLCVVASRFGGGVTLLRKADLKDHPALLQELQAMHTSTSGRLPMLSTPALFVGHITHMTHLGNLQGLNDPLQATGALEGRWTPAGTQDLHQEGHFTLGRLDVLLSAQLGSGLTFTSLGDVPQQVSALTFPASGQDDRLMRLYMMHPDPMGEHIDNQDLMHLTLKGLIQDLQGDLPDLHPLRKLRWQTAPPTTLVGQLKQFLADTTDNSLAGTLQVLDRHLPALLGEHGKGIHKAQQQRSVYDGRPLGGPKNTSQKPGFPVEPEKPAPAVTPAKATPAPQTKPRAQKTWGSDFDPSPPLKKPSTEPEQPEASPPAPKDWDQDF